MQEKFNNLRTKMSSKRMSINQASLMELVLLQLAYDYWLKFKSCTQIKENKSIHTEKLLVADAFNDAFKVLKREVGSVRYENIMDIMATCSDEVTWRAELLYGRFFEECITKFKYEDCEPVSLNLMVSTLLKASNKFCIEVLERNNKKTCYVVHKFTELSNKQRIKALNSDEMKFDTNKNGEYFTNLLNEVEKITKQYENQI